MLRRRLVAIALGLACVAGAPACGPSIDLKTALTVTDVLTGWYDDGVVNGQNHLVPSVSFRLKNTGAAPIAEVDLSVSFWRDGEDGEWQSVEVRGIGSTAVAPGGSTEPMFVRSDVGYNLPSARAELFANREFKDATVKLFAKRGGQIVPIGEFKLDRRIIPHLPQTSGRP